MKLSTVQNVLASGKVANLDAVKAVIDEVTAIAARGKVGTDAANALVESLSAKECGACGRVHFHGVAGLKAAPFVTLPEITAKTGKRGRPVDLSWADNLPVFHEEFAGKRIEASCLPEYCEVYVQKELNALPPAVFAEVVLGFSKVIRQDCWKGTRRLFVRAVGKTTQDSPVAQRAVEKLREACNVG